jgi:hypothetical protein
MATTFPTHAPLSYELLPVMRADNGPIVPHPSDRKYGSLFVGGQGCGKTSALLRMYLNDIRDPNAAVVLMDAKSLLARRALELTDPKCGKKVWYLDLGRPRFGMSPLRLTGDGPLDEQATAIGSNLAAAFEDLFEGQVFQASKHYLFHAVVGALAMAERRGRTALFSDVYALLSPHREDARREAAKACMHYPNLSQTMEFFRDELPQEIEGAKGLAFQRLNPPRNKLSALEAPPSLRRFFNHPTDISIRDIVEARDILIVACNMGTIGEDNAQAVLHFIMWMLHAQLQRQVQLPEDERPRVALICDEAHYIASSENIVNQIATHREAGLDVTFGLQYLAQIGAGSQQYGEKILKGILNLLQNRYFFRLGDHLDAENATRIGMAVYQSMIRSDPDSRAQMRITPESALNLANHWAMCSHIAMGSRAASFFAETYKMPRLDFSRSYAWARWHLALMEQVVGEYPENLVIYNQGIEPEPGDDTPPAGGRRDMVADDVYAALDGPAHAPAAASPPIDEPAAGTDAPDDDEPASADPPRSVDRGPADQQTPDALAADSGTSSDIPVADQPRHDAGDHGNDGLAASEAPADAPAAAGPGVPAPEPPLTDTHDRDTDDRTSREQAGQTPVDAPAGQLRIEDPRPRVQPLVRQQATPPDIQRSRVRRIVGTSRLADDQGVLFAEVNAKTEPTPPSLLEVAFIDQVKHVGEGIYVQPPEKLPRLSDEDFGVLALLDRVGLVVSGLIHQAIFPGRQPRSFRDRMKKLYDAGLVARHEITVPKEQRGPGSLPHVYSLTRHGFWMAQNRQGAVIPPSREWRAIEQQAGLKLRHDMHTLGWIIALHRLLGGHATDDWMTPRYATGRIPVPKVGKGRGRRPAGLFDIPTSNGIAPFDVQGEEFSEIRPDAIAEVRLRSDQLSFDILLELDLTRRASYNTAKFLAYDAFLLGWYRLVRRYRDRHNGNRPIVVFVFPDAHSALACAKAADAALTAHLGPLGSDPVDHYYPGREHIFFAVEADMHRGSPAVIALSPFPPAVRRRMYGHDDPQLERVALLPESVLRAGQKRGRQRD